MEKLKDELNNWKYQLKGDVPSNFDVAIQTESPTSQSYSNQETSTFVSEIYTPVSKNAPSIINDDLFNRHKKKGKHDDKKVVPFAKPSLKTSKPKIANDRKKVFYCGICEIAFKKSANVERHRSTVHESKKAYKCNQCDKTFAHSQTLKDHINREHLKVFRHKCKLCDKAFVTKISLDKHVRNNHIQKLNRYV